MDFPLDDFRSDEPGLETTGPPGSGARDARHCVVGLTRAPATMPTPSRTGAAGLVDYSRTFIGWTIWRERLKPQPGQATSGRLAVIATAALTSAGVTLLTMWLWSPGQVQAPGWVASQSVGTVTVSYERLDTGSLLEPVALAESLEPPEGPDQPEAAVSRQAEGRLRPVGQNATARPAIQQAGGLPVLPAPRVRQATAPPPVRKASLGPGVAAPARTANTGSGGVRAANPKAGLVVITQPEGARVTINGMGYGTTPLTIPYLSPGAKRVRVTKAGYESAERFVGTDTARAAVTLRIHLAEAASERPPR